MAFAVENVRLKELAVVAALNRPIFDGFLVFLQANGYADLHAFVTDKDASRAGSIISKFLALPLPKGLILYDGIARPYTPEKSKWLLLGWILRDAPEQRLRPMVASMQGKSLIERQAALP